MNYIQSDVLFYGHSTTYYLIITMSKYTYEVLKVKIGENK